MTDLATLALAIDSRPAVDASQALDRLTGSAERTGRATDGIRDASDRLVAALNANTAATTSLTARMAEMEATSTRARSSVTGLGSAVATTTTNVVSFDRAAASSRGSLDAMSASARNATAAWAALGAQGAATAQRLDIARRMAGASAVPMPGMAPPANQNGGHGAASGNYRDMILRDIAFQGKDFFEQAITGGSPFRAAITQAPQVATLMSMGGLGAGDVIGGIAGKAKDLAASGAEAVSRLGLVTGGLGLLATAAATGAYALSAYREQQKELELSVAGRGRASGATLGQINAVASDQAGRAGVSISSARDMAADYAATGRIGVEMYGSLLGAARDYAVTTRQEVPEANRALADAFAEPAKGAERLNTQLGFLDAELLETIQRFDAQGNRIAAQKALFDGLATSLVSADARLGFFARQWQEFTRNTGNETDAIGRFIDRGLGGGDAETRLAALKGQLDFRQRNMGSAGGIFDGLLGFDVETIKRQIAEVQAEIDRTARGNRQSDLAQRSQVVDRMVRGANPEGERLKQAEDSATRIRTELAAGVIDRDGSSLRTMQGFELSARRIREDLAAGGSELAASLRQATFDNRQVGASGLGRTSAQIEFDIAEKQRRVEGQNLEPNKRFEALQNLELERVTRLQTAQREAAINDNAAGGAFSRMSPIVQQQIQAAAQQFTRIPAAIIAGIAQGESGGNLGIGFSRSLGENRQPSSAYGLGQITAGTAREAVARGYLPSDFDRTDPATMAAGIAGVLSMKLDQNGGDINRALGAYRGSRDPAVNRDYAAQVLRSAGQMGDASEGSQIRAQDERTRNLQNENRLVDINNEFLGVNGEKLDAATRYQQLLNQAIAQGIEITPQYRAELMKNAEGMAAAARSLSGTRAGRDLAFDADQLGYDGYTAQARSRARGFYGDVTTDQSVAYVDQARDVAMLRDAKETFSGVFSGISSDLRHGASAAQVASNAFGKLADKLSGTLIDSLTSSLFSKDGVIRKLIGFDEGGYTGSSAPHVPVGIVHGSEFVFDARSTARIGVHALEAMRRGLPGYADGGPVSPYPSMPDLSRLPTMPTAANGNAPSVTDARRFTFDMRGSTLTEAQARAMFVGALAQYDAGLDRQLGGRVAASQRRYGRA